MLVNMDFIVKNHERKQEKLTLMVDDLVVRMVVSLVLLWVVV